MRRPVLTVLAAITVTGCATSPADGEHRLHILATNDVHGCFFDEPYAGGSIRNSLMAVKHYVDSIRKADGAGNVLLIDAGDCLQGDNATYYYNYVDTMTPHLYPRIARYMDYDAICVGNHDIETGHCVYDRVQRDLKKAGIPFLAANAIRNDNGGPYFQPYAIYEKAGLKVAVLGYTNADIKAWLDESIWSGMSFKSLIPMVQENVDSVIAREKPHVVIVAVHSGTGEGDGSIMESQAMDLFKSLKGVDLIISSHDHKALALEGDGMIMLNSGSRCRYLGHGEITVRIRDGRVESRERHASLIPVDAAQADPEMRERFRKDFEAVKSFTLKEVGKLGNDLVTADSFKGMCGYMNLIHTVSLKATGAQVSFAAPLTYNGTVKAGTLVFNDMFTIYPFENQLYVMNLSGKEIKRYLECSYDQWIQTIRKEGDHALKIRRKDDPGTGQNNWSFAERSYNFDSAAGICYTVDLTKPFNERIDITAMASGESFSEDATYAVAMTSYRASGGGDLIYKGTGLSREEARQRITAKYPELRNLIYEFVSEKGYIDADDTGKPEIIGNWKFMPEPMASRAIDKDFSLLFNQH